MLARPWVQGVVLHGKVLESCECPPTALVRYASANNALVFFRTNRLWIAGPKIATTTAATVPMAETCSQSMNPL
jgi:hypothetical protein